MSPHDKHDKPTPTLPDSVFEMFRLDGRLAVVTGAATGIGSDVCRAFAEAGANLALCYNSSEDKALKLAEEVEQQYKVKAKTYRMPLNAPGPIQEAIARIENDFGRIDILVANGGMVGPGPVMDLTDDAIQTVLSVNLTSAIWLARAVGPIFKRQGKGCFIATSSISSIVVNQPDSQALYNTTKAGLTHFVKSLAYDWRDFARCNIVAPGYFNTAMGCETEEEARANRYMTVLARQGDTKELKGAYLYLASDASSFTTGSAMVVDGGYTLG